MAKKIKADTLKLAELLKSRRTGNGSMLFHLEKIKAKLDSLSDHLTSV